MRVILLVAAMLTGGVPALAEMAPEFDVMDQDWAAVSFHEGPEVKICAAGVDSHRLMFRADSEGVQLRTEDASWSLSADTQGDVAISIGPYQNTFHMQAMDGDTLVTTITPEEAVAVLDAMDKASMAKLSFASRHVVEVSLAGSTKALNSFRACTGTHGFAALGGAAGPPANPFE